MLELELGLCCGDISDGLVREMEKFAEMSGVGCELDAKSVPRASASKARQCPSGEKIPPGWYRYPTLCGMKTATLPARAIWHSSSSRLWQARWTAISEVEQAVCSE